MNEVLCMINSTQIQWRQTETKTERDRESRDREKRAGDVRGGGRGAWMSEGIEPMSTMIHLQNVSSLLYSLYTYYTVFSRYWTECVGARIGRETCHKEIIKRAETDLKLLQMREISSGQGVEERMINVHYHDDDNDDYYYHDDDDDDYYYHDDDDDDYYYYHDDDDDYYYYHDDDDDDYDYYYHDDDDDDYYYHDVDDDDDD